MVTNWEAFLHKSYELDKTIIGNDCKYNNRADNITIYTKMAVSIDVVEFCCLMLY